MKQQSQRWDQVHDNYQSELVYERWNQDSNPSLTPELVLCLLCLGTEVLVNRIWHLGRRNATGAERMEGKLLTLLSLEDAQKAAFIPAGCGRGQTDEEGLPAAPVPFFHNPTLHLPPGSEPPCPLL